jgi:group I intron endonuclease
MSKTRWIIYLYTCQVNGKKYVGQTKHPNQRKSHHRTVYSDTPFSRAIAKHGWDRFRYEVIDTATSREDAGKKEEYWIRLHGTIVPFGYNVNPGGIHPLMSDETKKKLSVALTGKIRTQEQRERIRQARLGKKMPQFSDEHREKLRFVHLGKPKSEKEAARLRGLQLGNKHSPETRAKMSVSHIGFQHTEEHKASITGEGNYFYGKQHSLESKLLQRDNRRNNKLTYETAKAIRTRLFAGESGASLAHEYNVSTATICNIRKMKVWREYT